MGTVTLKMRRTPRKMNSQELRHDNMEQARHYEHQMSSALNALVELKLNKTKKPLEKIKTLLKEIEEVIK